MKFEKRDLVLAVGALLVVIGLMPFMITIYAIFIGVALFFGIKVLVAKRKQAIEKSVGEGICLECGFTIVNNKCPNCDKK